MATKEKDPIETEAVPTKGKKKLEKRASQTKNYEVPLRQIIGNTNPRNPLSASLQSQGWDCMKGEKQIWRLGVSEDAAERALFVQLIQDFDPELASLAATIRGVGLETPVEVRENHGSFTLVYGSRRCLATLFNWCLLGRPAEPWIEATLVKGNDAKLLTLALVENMRKQQSVIEEAKTIQQIVNCGVEKAEVAEQMGMSLSTLESRLKLLELDPKQQQKIHEGKATVKDARREHAEKNGKHTENNGDTSPPKPPLRKRKEIEQAMEEYAESTPQHKALAWVLGTRDKIG